MEGPQEEGATLIRRHGDIYQPLVLLVRAVWVPRTHKGRRRDG